MKKIIAVHNGDFHADDICAVATLVLAFPDIEFEIKRTREMGVIDGADFVVDVGQVYDPARERFDHHQAEGAGKRENGIPLASFGLVWKKYGEKISGSEKIAEKIDQKMIAYIDAVDNGVSTFSTLFAQVFPYTIHNFFGSFLTFGQSSEEKNEIFIKLVNIAKDLIKREIKNEISAESLKNEIESVYKEAERKEIIILSRSGPWQEILTRFSEPKFVVYPESDNGSWRAKSVPKTIGTFESRKQFPESWAGLSGAELAKASGVSDAIFCHRGRFLASAQTKEGAIKFAELALNS